MTRPCCGCPLRGMTPGARVWAAIALLVNEDSQATCTKWWAAVPTHLTSLTAHRSRPCLLAPSASRDGLQVCSAIMRVVVTGSAGRVGRAIVVRLAREHEVIGIDRLPASTAVQHVGDIVDRRVLASAFAGAQAVVHVAALHAPHVGTVPDAEFERVNVEGTAAVIAAARSAGIRRIVFTSTTALYGRANAARGRATWIDEDVEPSPLTIYLRRTPRCSHRCRFAAELGGVDAGVDAIELRVRYRFTSRSCEGRSRSVPSSGCGCRPEVRRCLEGYCRAPRLPR